MGLGLDLFSELDHRLEVDINLLFLASQRKQRQEISTTGIRDNDRNKQQRHTLGTRAETLSDIFEAKTDVVDLR